MNKLTQTLLINFHNHGVIRSHATFFGREINIPIAKGMAGHTMLLAFGRQQKLRRAPSVFHRSILELADTNKWK